MKKLVILLVVFLVLGGGAGAGWWFFLRDQPQGDEAEIAAQEATSLVSISRVIRLDPIILPVLREGRVTLHVTAEVVIELSTALEMTDLRVFSTPLRDSMLRELYGIYSARYVQERGYGIPLVRERLILAAERVLGEGMVKTVRLQNINKRVPASG
jgi:hypothetical protein